MIVKVPALRILDARCQVHDDERCKFAATHLARLALPNGPRNRPFRAAVLACEPHAVELHERWGT